MNQERSGKYRPNSGDSDWDKHSKDSGSIPNGVVLLALVAGLLFSMMGWRSAMKDYQELRSLLAVDTFTPTPAKWLKVGIRQDTTGANEDHYPDVLYEYFVGGKSVWGWRLSYEDLPHPRSFWEMRLRPYREGDTITAFVSTSDPKVALIEKKNDGLFRPYLKVGMGLVFVALGCLLLLVPLVSGISRIKKGIRP